MANAQQLALDATSTALSLAENNTRSAPLNHPLLVAFFAASMAAHIRKHPNGAAARIERDAARHASACAHCWRLQ